jgi:hypothetical protein
MSTHNLTRRLQTVVSAVIDLKNVFNNGAAFCVSIDASLK